MGAQRKERGQAEAQRKAPERAPSQEVPDARRRDVRGDVDRIGQQQHVNHGSHDDERHQCGEEGAQPQVADQHPVEQPHGGTGQQHHRHHRRHRPAVHVHEQQRDEVAESEVGPHAEVDATGHHHQHHGEDDERELAELARAVAQAAEREEVRDQRAEHGQHQHQREEGDAVVDPVLGQHLPDHVVGTYRERHRARVFSMFIVSCATEQAGHTARPVPCPYLRTSARFQQESGRSEALSITVMGVMRETIAAGRGLVSRSRVTATRSSDCCFTL